MSRAFHLVAIGLTLSLAAFGCVSALAMSAPAKSIADYGEWESPITAKFITSAGVGLSLIESSPGGDIFWLESRPEEEGRNVICRRDAGVKNASERGGVDVSPKDMNVRTRVHEYGGAAYVVGTDPTDASATIAVFSNFADQRLYKIRVDSQADADAAPECLTPVSESHPSEPAAIYRFADGVIDAERKRFICVREDHSVSGGDVTKVINAVVSVAMDGSGDTKVLAEGNDFYAAPRLSPDGKKLAYVTWNHPNMPWDTTSLIMIKLDENGDAQSEVIIVGEGAEASVLQPAWSPSGELHFVSDASNGFWNIHVVPGSSEAVPDGSCASGVKNIFPKEADFSGGAPGWFLGQQGFTFLPDGRIVTAYPDKDARGSRLVLLSQEEGVENMTVKEFSREDGLPYSFGGITPTHDGSLLLMGMPPDKPNGIFRSAILEGGPTEMLVSSVKATSQIDPGYISIPKQISFPTPDPTNTGCLKAYGYFYPPCNSKYEAPPTSLPPLLVKAHGGPTACTGTAFKPGIQFWTSRGFAILDVDYRGSTGYGRAYRRALRGNWGICDIEDVVAGAEYLVKEGKVNKTRLAIDGGSAGGYTTLGALAFKDTFTAGCSLYGVADLSALASDTHKFESRYLDGLVGAFPADEKIYKERAPINSADSLSCPVLLLQGDEDKIVPPNQAELMHKVLLDKGIPTALRMYKGEQHGFRKAENIQDALNSELFFYGKCWGFKPAGDIPSFSIDNL